MEFAPPTTTAYLALVVATRQALAQAARALRQL